MSARPPPARNPRARGRSRARPPRLRRRPPRRRARRASSLVVRARAAGRPPPPTELTAARCRDRSGRSPRSAGEARRGGPRATRARTPSRRPARATRSRSRAPRARAPGTGSCTSALASPASATASRSASTRRGGAGSSTTPPPTVVSVRRTKRSPRAATTGAASRSCARESSARTTRAAICDVPWWTLTAAGTSAIDLEPHVEPVARHERIRRDQRVAARELVSLDPGEVHGDTLAGFRALDVSGRAPARCARAPRVPPARPAAGRRRRSTPTRGCPSRPCRRRGA